MENLIEAEDVGIESFHPGGVDITRELAELCRIGPETSVLDVASGSGETACFLADALGARVTGVDISDHLLARARRKAVGRSLAVEFVKGDAQNLEFANDSFDVVISECTLCLLDKAKTLSEMVRVARPGGRVGIHDVCWRPDTPDRLKERLRELEGEEPETLRGWKRLFEDAGLVDVCTVDKPGLMGEWTKSLGRTLGLAGRLRIFGRVLRRWGVTGLLSVLASERIFRSRYTGYGIIAGTKPG